MSSTKKTSFRFWSRCFLHNQQLGWASSTSIELPPHSVVHCIGHPPTLSLTCPENGSFYYMINVDIYLYCPNESKTYDNHRQTGK